MFESVLVANRGEIARRVFRTLHALGIRAIAVHTDADRHSPHVREADDAVRIASYLDIEAVLEAAAHAGAAAVHPGYGFLSENPAFARACAGAGLTFVGPPPEAMELLGDKLRAKAAAEAAGVPVVPSFTVEEARAAGDAYPLLVKAAAGGGGRGMRVVESPDRLDDALASAAREAQAGFGDDRVFIERYLPRARHVEVQLMDDVALGERECSLQRRHQKLVEEAPSPAVSPALRERLCAEAVALARAVGYRNAGTVEFIVDARGEGGVGSHYFLEVNARLQVEHPVTELVTGLDLVELQLRSAAGEELSLGEVPLRGHAIEARVTAEDAGAGFLPSAGRVLAYRRPGQARVDDAIEAGSEVGTEYDSLVAKVIAHAHDRETALARLDRALAETAVLGVTTTTGFLRGLLARDEVRAGELDTRLVERLEPAGPRLDEQEVARAAALIALALAAEEAGDDPFARVDGWRMAGLRAATPARVAIDGGAPVEVLARHGEAEVERLGPDLLAIDRRAWSYAVDGDTLWLGRDGDTWRVRRPSVEEAAGAGADGDLRAPMPGQVLLVPKQAGDAVRAGEAVVVLESMKMELSITAPADGVVADVAVAVGDRVTLDQPLARVERSAGEARRGDERSEAE
jgi:acetyl-CoA/propionyl-CoA carboxylase biotin carboxyl carrier protein